MADEQEWFREVVEQIEAELTQLKDEITDDLKEHAHILDLHLLILRERMFYADTLKLIQEQHLNAERALHQSYLKIKELFQRIGDKHIRGRLADVETVYRRVMGRLTGKDSSKPFAFKEPAIVVARDLSPAETTQMSKAQVLGFITERGGKTSHTAIIAHSLEIPAVVGLDSATVEIESGDLIILDGITGVVILDPDDSLRRIYQARRADFEIFKSEVVLGQRHARRHQRRPAHPGHGQYRDGGRSFPGLQVRGRRRGAVPHRVPLSAPAPPAHGRGAFSGL